MRVRGARWRILDVQPHESCRIFTLAGIDVADGSVERRFIEPFDCIDPVERTDLPAIVGAAHWRRVCRALVAADDPYPSLTAARPARIALLPHQLEPALAILAGKATRLLLADGVGLGKTIEAALIVSELRRRGWIERVLVLTPAGLRDQWREELRERFDIAAIHVDAPALRQLAGTLPVGFNPWTTMQTAIASVDYVKRAEVLPAVCACRWDLVIVDEAHGVVGDSDRRHAVEAIASRAAYVLLLTATPHNGDTAAYEALRRIGCIDGDPLHVFRRTRANVLDPVDRRVHTLRVRLNRHERRMHLALAHYGEAVRAEAETAALAMSVLHKRAYSSAWALLQSVNRRLAALEADSETIGQQLALPLGDALGEFSTEDEAPEWPEELALADTGRERRLLAAVAAACVLAASRESKIDAIARLLRRTSEPAIIFTEYRDTLLHLQRQLSGVRVVLLHGGLSRSERADALLAFSRADASTVLLATDAAGEGLNLHHTCRLVVNLELPWNPMRLEQRIGRVDRIRQSRRVHVVHLVARATGEARIYTRLEERVARARTAVGAPNPLGRYEADGMDATARRDLDERAIAEADRLGRTRAFGLRDLARLDDAGDADRPHLVAAPHLRRLRMAIGSKTLLLFRTSIENAAGRRLASRVVAVVVDGVPQVRGHRDMKRIAQDLARAVVEHLEGSGSQWKDNAVSGIDAFTAMRLARERSLASKLDGAFPALVQTSLFDSRARRAHDTHEALVLEAQDEARARIAALEVAGRIEAVRHQLLLAVLP